MGILLILFILDFQFSSLAWSESIAAPEPSTRPSLRCNDDKKIYKICVDQKITFDEKLIEAKARNLPLVVVFGTDWCSRCRELHKILPTKIKDKLVLSGIGILDGHKIVPSGQDLLDETLKTAKLTRKQLSAGTPYVFVLDPRTRRTKFIPSGRIFEMLDQPKSTEIQWLNLLRPPR